jgi:hypothetical protein
MLGCPYSLAKIGVEKLLVTLREKARYHQLHPASRLLYHLTRAFACPDAVYLAEPVRIQGGFDAAIFGGLSGFELPTRRQKYR